MLFLLVAWGPAIAQQSYLPPLQLRRTEENYSALQQADFQPNNWLERMKYLALSTTRKHYLSVGGEVRFQYEWFANNNWGEGTQDPSGWWLQRYLLHTDWHAGHFRLFGQLQSGLLLLARPDPRGIDRDDLGVHQLFAEYTAPSDNTESVTVRLGRQELWYGSRRLVSVREGPNLRQSFDAAKLMYRRPPIQVDAFYGYYIDNEFEMLDNRRLTDERLWGVYSVWDKPLQLPVHADLYYLGFQSPFRAYQEGAVDQTRHSIGLRLWRTSDTWRFDHEAVYQFGTSSAGDIRAYTLAIDITRSLSLGKAPATLGLKTALISGDQQAGDGRLQTFNALYPRGAYFGLIALIGPSNLLDVHPILTVQLAEGLSLMTDWNVFWRHRTGDGVYGPNATLQRSGLASNRHYLGHQPGFEVAYEPNRYWQLALEGSWFAAGKFFRQTGTGQDVVHLITTARFKF